MATFDEVRAFVYHHYLKRSEDPLDLHIDVPLPKGRSQSVMLHKVATPQGQDYLRMISFIAPANKIDPISCLRFNASCLGGYLALGFLNGEETLAMCHTQVLSTVDKECLENSIQRIARSADTLERKLFAKDDF